MSARDSVGEWMMTSFRLCNARYRFLSSDWMRARIDGRKAEGLPTAMLPAAKAAERRTSSDGDEKCSTIFSYRPLWPERSLRTVFLVRQFRHFCPGRQRTRAGLHDTADFAKSEKRKNQVARRGLGRLGRVFEVVSLSKGEPRRRGHRGSP